MFCSLYQMPEIATAIQTVMLTADAIGAATRRLARLQT
jgi:hypothetical protein